MKFDPRQPLSIFAYSKQLVGHSLREAVGTAFPTQLRKGKGNLGQMVEELFFGYAINGKQEADFQEAGVELKCTPLQKYQRDDTWRIKERLVCTMIDFHEVVNHSFETSHVLEKCRLMLLMFYFHEVGRAFYDFEFVFSVLWLLPPKDLEIIRQDYEHIVEKIRRGEAHLLSEGDTMYLGACRKGQKGDKLQSQPYSTALAPKRAFSLKPAYMRTILNEVVNSGACCYTNYTISTSSTFSELVSPNALKEKTFEEILLARFRPFYQQDYCEIATALGVQPTTAKHKYALLANAIASAGTMSDTEKAEEFIKSGIRLKTVRISTSGSPKEAMSFKNIDFEELYNNGLWLESELYELFTSRFLFVVYREVKDREVVITAANGQEKREKAYVLEKAFFWTMPPEDLQHALAYWVHLRRNVIHNRMQLNDFWSISDNKKFHVRPKGTKLRYKKVATNPHGGQTDKFCYWFNADYVKHIIDSTHI